MNKKMKKKLLFRSSFLFAAAIPLLPAVVSSTNTNNQISSLSTTLNAVTTTSNWSIDTSYEAEGYDLLVLQDSTGADSGIGVKVPNFSNTSSEDAQTTANTILDWYKRLPSNVASYADTSANTNYDSWDISNLIYVNPQKWQTTGANKVKIFNIGASASYSSYYKNGNTGTTPTAFDSMGSVDRLPAFDSIQITGSDGSVSQENVTENLLNSMGLLCLQITVSPYSATDTGARQWQSFYVEIPGFGGSLNPIKVGNATNVMLPTSFYANGVSSISNADLIDYFLQLWEPSNSSENSGTTPDETISSIKVYPSLSITNRENNGNSGVVSYTIDFSFTTDMGDTIGSLDLSSSFTGFVDSATTSLNPIPGQSIAVSKSSNAYVTSVSYDRTFVSQGFQPTPAVSDTQVIYITIGIIATIVAISIILFIVTVFSKKIRFRNAM